MADDIMHVWQKFWNSCVLVKHLIYSLEWQTSNSVLYCTILYSGLISCNKDDDKAYLLFSVVVCKNNSMLLYAF